MLIDNQVTRLGNGIVNRDVGHIFASMKKMDPTRYHTYMEDFDRYLLTEWVVTEVGIATQVLADVDGGVLLITNAAADNNSSFQNKVGESFLFAVGNPLFFSSRFAVSDAVESDVLMGLQITDTTPVDATDGVFFLKADGAATVDLIARKNSVDVTLAAFTSLVTATFIELSFYWDGISQIWAGVNGAPVGRITPGVSLPDDEVLTVSFGVQNGEAVAKTMSVDYVYAAKER